MRHDERRVVRRTTHSGSVTARLTNLILMTTLARVIVIAPGALRDYRRFHYTGHFPHAERRQRYIIRFMFFFQAEDGIRDHCVTGVQTCAFFFSSRRRHTRSLCDWSSDVCSSDLKQKTAYEITV